MSASIDEWAAVWKPLMRDYYTRFGDTSWAWDMYLELIKEYYNVRAGYILDLL